MHTHSGQLARWLGEESVGRVSAAMKDWYGPPIALSGVPGNVWAHRGGDFTGPIRAGYEVTALDRAHYILARLKRGYRRACRPNGTLNAGFTSLSDLINEVTTNSKRQQFEFFKAGTTGVVGGCNSLWRLGSQPAAGSAASAAPGGTVPDRTTTGAMPLINPAGGDTTHITTGFPIASVVNMTMLLYDRLFSVAKTASSTTTEAVTGVPTRYTSTTTTDPDYAAGNFVFPECGTSALGATNHNWTVCKYTNQAGTTGQTIPSVAGNNANVANRIDLPVGTWFMPLASGDAGVKALTQMQNSASVTGALDFVIGHPLAIMPCIIANVACAYDGLNSAFGMVRVFDSACMALLDICKSATTATNFSGSVLLASG